MIEAVRSGVSTHSVANSFYHEKCNVCVLRYCDPVFSRLAAAKAGLFLGKGYSVQLAIKSILPDFMDASEPQMKTFCSALFELHVSVADDIDAFVCQWDLSFEIPTTFFETPDFLGRVLMRSTDSDDLPKEVCIPALQSIHRMGRRSEIQYICQAPKTRR
ncbi:MAG: hypothetical protein KUG61_05075 [Parvibaculaceae bacterium]|nr:hypothetical protein [Parvibaculaceae bacterium]